MKVKSFMRLGYEFTPVEVELSLSPGLPQISFLGMPDPFIRESVLRIKSALKEQGFEFPKAQQVLVQLRPSHLKKTSRGLDLAVAAALLWETQQVAAPENAEQLYLYGELSLKGEVIVPDDLYDAETCIDDDVVVTGLESQNFAGKVWPIAELKGLFEQTVRKGTDSSFNDVVRPQPKYKLYSSAQADLISVLATGGHTALMVGTPGSGKSVTAECINAFLPAPSPQEWKEIRKVAQSFNRKISWRPNVVAHHSITSLAMTGGGGQITAGEITRAHGGTLVMDELLEFRTSVQESLREPLETGQIEIARQGKFQNLPARFQLIATSNLCRCGQFVPGGNGKKCRCSNNRLRQYQDRLSGPILDRFSIVSLFDQENAREKRQVVADQITRAVLRGTDTRLARGQKQLNHTLSMEQIEEVLGVGSNTVEAFAKDLVSQRTKTQLMQVARTWADIEGCEKVKREHLARAEEFVVKKRDKLIRSLSH